MESSRQEENIDDDENNHVAGVVSTFSSRGMTLWNSHSRVKTSSMRNRASHIKSMDGGIVAENRIGMGRIKPDILAPSYRLRSSSHSPPYRCRSLSGTSVANPIVVGTISLLLSSLSGNPVQRSVVSNIAAMKQILTHTAKRLKGFSVFEQGLCLNCIK